MSAHNEAVKNFGIPEKLDPGNAGTIFVDRSPFVMGLVSAGAETRTLSRPTAAGTRCLLYHRTDGGDITLTVTGGFNEDGDTTFTFSDAGQFIELISTYFGSAYVWRKTSDYGLGNIAPVDSAVLDELSGLTASASELNYLDSDGGTSQLSVTAGVGITGGTGTVYKNSVQKFGNIIKTTIYVDLTGLTSKDTDGDIIGVSTGGAAHIGRITAAINGTIESMSVYCEETPAGGLADIDVFRATVATGVYDDAISGITGQATTGAVNITTTATIKCATAVPAANDYLYLCAGASSGAGTYTAGKLRIELLGY